MLMDLQAKLYGCVTNLPTVRTLDHRFKNSQTPNLKHKRFSSQCAAPSWNSLLSHVGEASCLEALNPWGQSLASFCFDSLHFPSHLLNFIYQVFFLVNT